MRVAYVTSYYNGQVDGRFGRFHDWVHTARDYGSPFDFDVHAFTVSNPDETLAGTPHGYLGDAASLWGTKKNKLEFLLNARRVRRDLMSTEYDLVHVVLMDSIVYPTALSAIADDTPIVMGPDIAGWSPVRDVAHWDDGPLGKLENRVRFRLKNAQTLLYHYDHVIAFSEHHRNIVSSFGVRTEDITILEPGVSPIFATDERAEPNDPPELLYVGDFSEHKGYPHFLEALSELDRSVTARVAGAGDPNEARIAELGLEDVVTVEGFVPRPELPSLYRDSDLVVIPSIDETAGTNVQFEALASGKPVVLTDKLGINEYAPDRARVAFSPRTVPNLVDALERAIDDLDELTAVARRQAPNYRADKPLEQLAALYEKIVAEHG